MSPERAVLLNAPIPTERLVLEPLVGDHAPAMFAPMQDPRVYQWISMSRPLTEAGLRRRWTELETRLSPDGELGWLGWAVRRAEDGAYIGKTDATIDGPIATNVGYLFFSPFWGHGYATEAVRALGDYLLRSGTSELRATVTVGNDASGRVLEKAGFVRGRILPDNDVIRGVPHDDIEYLRFAEPG